MDQISAVGDEDMFLDSENQEQLVTNADDMYISLCQAIAVKKCRIVQKKEKLKLALQTLKKIDAELEVSKKESENIQKESEELVCQLNIKAGTLKVNEDHRASLESALCNLKSKVSFLDKETTEKKNKFDAVIRKAEETWKRFKDEYEEFPLAKKRSEFVIQLKKADIEFRKTEFDVKDLKLKNKIKAEIAEKKKYQTCIKLAKAFFKRKEKIAEIYTQSKRISELKKRSEDGKDKTHEEDNFVVAKPTSQPPSQTKQKATKSSLLQFKMPQFLLSPPQAVTEEEPPFTGLYSWKNLFSPSNLLNILGKTRTKAVEQPKTTKSNETSVQQSVINTNTLSVEAKSHSAADKTTHLTNTLSKNLSSETNQILAKRKNNSQVENELTQTPVKKVRFSTSQNEENCRNSISSLSNQIKETCISNGPSGKVLHSPAAKTIQMMNKPTAHNLKNNSPLKPSVNQQNVLELHFNTVQSKSSLDSNNSYHTEQLVNKTLVGNSDDVDLFQEENNENHPDNVQLNSVPTPPDVIPVENNSQPTPESASLRSLSPEFTSPLELDESEKMHYLRMTDESPKFVYTKGLEVVKPQKMGTEESGVVKSHYFSDIHQQVGSSQTTLETVSPEEEYYTPYSPATNIELGSDQEVNTNVFSPISQGLGYFGFGESTSSGKQFNQPSSSDGNDEGQCGFSFMGNPSKKSSFFSLF